MITRPDDVPEHTWNELTEEEKAAYLSDDVVDEADDSELGGEEDEVPIPGKLKDDKQKAKVEEQTAAEEPKVEEPKTAATEGEDPPVVEEPKAKQRYQPPPVPLPEDHEQRMAAFDEQAEALDVQLDDGAISAAEWRKEMRAIDAGRAEIREAVLEARIRNKVTEEAQETRWNEDVVDFIGDFGDVVRNPAMRNAFDTVVRQITADAANAHLSNRTMLAKARSQLYSDLGVPEPGGKAAAAPTTQKPAPRAAPASPVPPKAGDRKVVTLSEEQLRRRKPPTLGGLPAAEAEDTGESEFADLEREDGLSLEDKIAKMKPEDRERYLMGG